MLLVVAESSGSSPGRQGYKMAVGADGELHGSIGGGVMEVNLVEESRSVLRDAESGRRGDAGISSLSAQVHRENSQNSSGMICSGEQTVIFRLISQEDSPAVESAIDALSNHRRDVLRITPGDFMIASQESAPKSSPPDDASSTTPLPSFAMRRTKPPRTGAVAAR